MQLPDVDAVELVRNLRSRLSRVLRRDEKIATSSIGCTDTFRGS